MKLICHVLKMEALVSLITAEKLAVSANISSTYITKTCLYNTDPLKPHFYIVKLGFTGVYIIFVISAQKT